MNKYQHDLIKEHQKLIININTLGKHINNFPKCITSNEIEEYLDLHCQYTYMSKYLEVLESRLYRAGIESHCGEYYENVTNKVNEPTHEFGSDYDVDKDAKVADSVKTASILDDCKPNE